MHNTFVHQLVGQTVGEYFIERLLGQGALGVVYQAQQPGQQRSVLLLVLLMPEDFSSQARERFLARFRQESEQLVQLSHPNLVPLYDFGEHAGSPYLVLPLLKGRSLANLLKELGRFTPHQARDILMQVAAGLDYAHEQGIVHGSLNPATILLDEQHVVQVAEMGFVHLLEMSDIESNYPYAHRFSIAGTFLGSSAYVAPEWVEIQTMDARTDIYALGVIALELLTGKRSLTNTPSLAKAGPSALPPELEAIIRQARERDPARRFQSAGQMARAFEQAVQALPEVALAPLSTPATILTRSPSPQPPRESRRRVVALLVAGGVVAAGICGVTRLDLSRLMQPGPAIQTAQDQAHAATPLAPEPTATPEASPTATKAAQKTPTPGSTPTSASTLNPAPTRATQPTPTPTRAPQPTPTPTPKPPAPTPTPVPTPTGTTIGSTDQPLNTARNFVNPADGNLSFLIHLPDDSFVAYEKTCTDESVLVRYNRKTHKLVCPKHHAIFDPANGGNVVHGPAPSPLPSVTISVNADGTITTG